VREKPEEEVGNLDLKGRRSSRPRLRPSRRQNREGANQTAAHSNGMVFGFRPESRSPSTGSPGLAYLGQLRAKGCRRPGHELAIFPIFSFFERGGRFLYTEIP
jgi:hypothetical protein